MHKIVAFANNADSPPFVTFISTTNYTVVAQVVLDGTNGTPNATNGIRGAIGDVAGSATFGGRVTGR